ncbi:MAG TPA: sigma factor-like helix-turn-helix DNA-binding protein [Intrasporangium sp.]|uniref:RNA polymerase sigma factor n=1 Tax=Intrasporangium sp. TaxID=1925024 RepID=UPI002F95F9CF
MSNHDTGPPCGEQRFTELFAETYASVLRFIQRRVHPSHAEDIASEVFLVAWRRLADVPEDPDDARAWLFGVARLTLLSGVRGQLRQQALAVRVAENGLGQGSDSIGFDPDLVARRLDLAQAWRRLSTAHQEALSLTVWDGLDSPRAARVLGISPVAYRLRLSRARRALRALAESLPQARREELPEAETSRSTS